MGVTSGSLENKGLELTLNTVNIDTKGFQWRSNFVFSLNRNKVVEMDTETGSLPYELQIGDDKQTVTNSMPGYPIGQFGEIKLWRFRNRPILLSKLLDGTVKE